MDVLMSLGDFRFSVATAAYQSVARATEYRWASLDRINRGPSVQWIGPGQETMDLEGTIMPHYRGGLGQVDAMRAQAGRGEPLVMTSGVGDALGRWVILTIQERFSSLLGPGLPRRIDFALRLQRYPDETDTASSRRWNVDPFEPLGLPSVESVGGRVLGDVLNGALDGALEGNTLTGAARGFSATMARSFDGYGGSAAPLGLALQSPSAAAQGALRRYGRSAINEAIGNDVPMFTAPRVEPRVGGILDYARIRS
jgi:phage protein U